MNVDLTAPTRPAPPASGPDRPAGTRIAFAVAFVAVIAVAIAMRFAARSDLWLDEALTVNIAKLPLDRLRPALLHDGAPPLYYVLLHVWMSVFGSSTVAVRALSGTLGVIAVGLGALAGAGVGTDAGPGAAVRRARGPGGGDVAVRAALLDRGAHVRAHDRARPARRRARGPGVACANRDPPRGDHDRRPRACSTRSTGRSSWSGSSASAS